MTDTTTITPPDTREEITVTDTLGRVLRVKKLSILEEMNLLEAAGELADNRRWFTMATIAATVRWINDVPQPTATSKAHIKSSVIRVGSEGIAAVVAALMAKDEAEGTVPGEAKAAA